MPMSQPDDTDSLIAADGGRLHPAAHTTADLLRIMEHGQFDADLSTQIRDLIAGMEDLWAENHCKMKAEIDIKISLIRDPDGFYRASGKFKIKPPEQPRVATLLWATDDNALSPNQPQQRQMFGTIRDVSVPARVIR